MSDLLKVATISLDIANNDKPENMRRVGAAIDLLPKGVDLIVLPEMFSTGFICRKGDATAHAEWDDGDTLNAIRGYAKRLNAAICGSYIACNEGNLYNRAFFIAPDGAEHYYNKHHLFAPGCEDDVYIRGTTLPPVFDYRGWRIAMAVCFDLRFPAWVRNRCGADRYDLLLIVANWPDSRAYSWRQLLIARAIENQSYVIGVNRTGTDDYGDYSGTTAVVDAKGTPAADATVVDLSLSSLQSFREKFPVLDEADIISVAPDTCHFAKKY
jgi:predicted amidohydrolase